MFLRDLRILESVHLSCDESSLTGESNSVSKVSRVIGGEVSLGDRVNMAFRGTNVTGGRGLGVVVATGMETEIGKIAGMLQAKSEEEQTPIQKNLKRLGIFLTIAAFVVAVIMFILEIVGPGAGVVDAFMTAVAVAVARKFQKAFRQLLQLSWQLAFQSLRKRGQLSKT